MRGLRPEEVGVMQAQRAVELVDHYEAGRAACVEGLPRACPYVMPDAPVGSWDRGPWVAWFRGWDDENLNGAA